MDNRSHAEYVQQESGEIVAFLCNHLPCSGVLLEGGPVMGSGQIVVWIDHKNKLISCTRLETGVLYRFVSFDALCAYCQPLLEDRYRLQ